MNELQLVTFEQAKQLKEIGFDWNVNTYYFSDGELHQNVSINGFSDWNIGHCYFSAPTVALALQWIRDVKKTPNAVNFWDVVSWAYEGSYQVCNIIDIGDKRLQPRTTYTTPSNSDYNIAESALLDELLNILEKQN